MNYATRAQMESRFGAAEVQGLAGTNANVVDEAIADASAKIDAKLRGRYALPFDASLAELTAIACDIARFLLYKDAAPDIVVKRYDTAMSQLRDYASGISTLDVPGDTTDANASDIAVVASPAIFNDTLLATMPHITGRTNGMTTRRTT